MLDYLQNSLPTAIRRIRVVLHKVLVDGMTSWGTTSWRLAIGNLIDSSDLGTETKTRHALENVIQTLESFARVEVLSLLALAAFKTTIDSMGTSAQVNHNSCRLLCGANLVKTNVLAFIWDSTTPNPKGFVSLSMFPCDVTRICGYNK